MYNHRSLVQTVAPTSEPVALADAQAWARVDTGLDTSVVQTLISACREWVEAFTGRQLMPATFVASWDRFPLLPNSQYAPGNPNAVTPVLNNMWPLNPAAWALRLPAPPLISVTSIQYIDQNQVLQTMDPSTYVVDAASVPGRVTPSTGSFWPQTSFMPAAVKVTYQAGYSGQVPFSIIQAIKSLVSYQYDNRDAVIVGPSLKIQEAPMGVKNYLWAHRVMMDF